MGIDDIPPLDVPSPDSTYLDELIADIDTAFSWQYRDRSEVERRLVSLQEDQLLDLLELSEDDHEEILRALLARHSKLPRIDLN
ncbi:hypothetical protein HY346_01870 [Candidatus Microgenomates bacterium]|nr:hypothetical protein [Candidatus Microgenomates bacterium]